MIEKEEIGITIENYDECINGSKTFVFKTKGGSIGSGEDCTFRIQDKLEQIKNTHAIVSYEEGSFTIAPFEDSDIYYNKSFSKVPSGYEIIISIGDIFKIGNLEFRFVDAKSIKESIKENKKYLEDIEKRNRFDEIEIEPRGKTSINFDKNEELKEILKNNDYKFIEKEKADDSFLKEITQNSHSLEHENILKSLVKNLKDIKTKQQSSKLDKDYSPINIKDFESIINNIPLIKSTRLINILALSLITKELYTPIFEEMEENIFIKYLEAAIQNNIKEDKILFENLTIKALEKYIKDFE
ncbi:TPA: FHA domain-containing protein [Campylobacter jejuni]|nr:FHA domain-containing protein [Campylobacter jejuni]HDZ5087448.1 FHA domain-containing protein [Campylobacter jejuni]HDZ5090981.1 FHA domain-containing protein [Campylobacter jejuni]HDZ5092552.1 FHA domain-containing protein [Campylobacter jejuni]HDZ5097562.1 FHA domain-containing protein [Campylobacter jejuni]